MSSADGSAASEAYESDGSLIGSYTPEKKPWVAGAWSTVAVVLTMSSVQMFATGGELGPVSPSSGLPLESRFGYVGRGPLTGTLDTEGFWVGGFANLQVRARGLELCPSWAQAVCHHAAGK